MCQSDGKASRGWKGWNSVPAPQISGSDTTWLDLTWPLGDATPVPSVPKGKEKVVSPFPEARFERIRSMPEFPVNLSEMQMVVHFGTHVDAPVHFIEDGPAFHEIPLERLYGQGVMIDLACTPVQSVSVADLESSDIRAGDIVLLNTGWTAHAGTELYDEHPHVSEEAAVFLADKGIKLLAVDFPSPDLPIAHRQPGFNWPTHHVLLSQGILVSENIRIPAALQAGRAEFLFLALNIEGSDGSPARVLGRNIQG